MIDKDFLLPSMNLVLVLIHIEVFYSHLKDAYLHGFLLCVFAVDVCTENTKQIAGRNQTSDAEL